MKNSTWYYAALTGALTLFANVSIQAEPKNAEPSLPPANVAKWDELLTPDLSNMEFPEGVWTLENGELTASEDKVIWTKKDFQNFILDFEFKNGPNANSGVLLYVTDTAKWIPNSVEVQLLDDSGTKWEKADPKWKCGGIFGRVAPSKSTVKPAGEWNRCIITCRGPHIEVVLNGEKVSSMDMTKWTSASHNPDGSEMPAWLNKPLNTHPTKGRIGFQGKHGGAPVWFRNIKIQDIP
jgi:hypothetical protein